MRRPARTLRACLCLLAVALVLLAVWGSKGGAAALAAGLRRSIGATPSPAASPTARPSPTTAVTPSPTATATIVPTPTPPAPGTLGAQLDAYMSSLGETFSGAVLVARQGEILHSRGYGPANRGTGLANGVETQYNIASLTKAFTALAILILQERGQLNVQDPVSRYLPDCPEAWAEITLHHLLTHTSGIPDYLNDDLGVSRGSIEQAADPNDVLAVLKDQPLLETPGEHYSYDNSGYLLLGLVIERVSGQSYGDFLQRNILQPLHLQDTGYADCARTPERCAQGYSYDEDSGRYDAAETVSAGSAFAAGGLYSTVGDLYAWDQALYGNALLSSATLELLFSPHVPEGDGAAYGYGWNVTTLYGHRLLAHNGDLNGFNSTFYRFPDDRVTVIVLENISPASNVEVATALAEIVFADS